MKQSTKKGMTLLGVAFSLFFISLLTQGFCMILAEYEKGVNPCQNESTRKMIDIYVDVDGYYGCHVECECLPGYTGEFCEKKKINN